MTREDLFAAIGMMEESRLERTEYTVTAAKGKSHKRVFRHFLIAAIVVSMLAVTGYAVAGYMIFENPEAMITAIFGDKTGFDHKGVTTWSDPEKPGSVYENSGFDRVPVDGSTRMDDTLMESIEPFDYKQAVDFQTAYLAGYLANKYDVDAQASIQRANERIRRSTESAFARTVIGYTSVIPVSTGISLSNSKGHYALCPVWILNTVWNGNTSTFAINGQTGRIAGDLPVDKGLYTKWLLGISAVAAAAVYAISYLLWLL